MALVLNRRGRRTDREHTAAQSTPTESPHPTLPSIFRRLRLHAPPPDTVAATVIPSARPRTVVDQSHITEAAHSQIAPISLSYRITPTDLSRLRTYGMNRVKTVILAITRKPHAPLALSRSSMTASESGHRYATAADIPPELYDLILFFMESLNAGHANDGEQQIRNRVVVGQRELGRLGLVCWSWAGMCQAKMYQVLTLRSVDDFRKLEMLASHRCSRISQYVEHLQLEPYSKARPWIHVVCLKVLPGSTSLKREGPQFPNNTGHFLVLYRKEGLAVLKRGLHAALPRRVPGTFSQGITRLHLDGMELPGMGEVVRLSRALPSLQYLVLRDVTWVAPTSTDAEAYALLTRRHTRKQYGPVGVLHLIGCTDTWAVLPLLCLLDSTRPMCANDLAALAKLAQALTASVEKAGHPKPLTWATRYEWGYILTVGATLDRLLAPLLSFATVHDAEQGFWHVDVIVLDFIQYKNATIRPLREMAGFDWASIDEHAASLPFLRHLIVGLITREDVAFFAKEIEPKMPLLSCSRRLKYALRYLDSSKVPDNGWVACIPDKVADKDLINSKRVHVYYLHTLYS